MSSQINYLDNHKSQELISMIKNLKHRLLVLIMMDAGLRVSEACHLKIKNFNFKKRIITVKSLKTRGDHSERSIPISNRLYNALADYIQKTKVSAPEDYLFQHKFKAGNPIRRQGVNMMLDRFKYKNAGFQNLHPHALRHTFATNLLAHDANLVQIKELLGHVSYDTTLIYTHVPIELLRKKIDESTRTKLTPWQKFTRMLIKEDRKYINIAPEGTNFVIGRNDEVKRINELASKGINTIIMGGIGTGKSTVLNQLSIDGKILKIDDMLDFKNTLINALMYLYKYDKEAVFELMFPKFTLDQTKIKLTKHSMTALANQLISITEKNEYTLLIDNVDRITPRYVKILEVLKDHFTILTTAREIAINKSSFLWNFEVVRLHNLARGNALELIHRLSYDMEIEDTAFFRNHIFEQSAGNPRVIFELVERYRKETFISNDIVRQVKHYGSLPEYDMSLVVMLGLGGLAILRYLAIETGDNTMKFFGGAALIGLILFRHVFRFTRRRYF